MAVQGRCQEEKARCCVSHVSQEPASSAAIRGVLSPHRILQLPVMEHVDEHPRCWASFHCHPHQLPLGVHKRLHPPQIIVEGK